MGSRGAYVRGREEALHEQRFRVAAASLYVIEIQGCAWIVSKVKWGLRMSE